MSPEEHFRRLRDDDVWQRTEASVASAARPAEARKTNRDRGPFWVTAFVGASLVVITLASVQGARPAVGGGAVGAPAAAPTTEASATPSSTPTPTETRSVDPSDPSLRSVMFYPNDAADMARARTIIACFKRHGVKIVKLEPSSDDPKVYNIGYGGKQNDHDSIVTGLKYQDKCFKAGGPVD